MNICLSSPYCIIQHCFWLHKHVLEEQKGIERIGLIKNLELTLSPYLPASHAEPDSHMKNAMCEALALWGSSPAILHVSTCGMSLACVHAVFMWALHRVHRTIANCMVTPSESKLSDFRSLSCGREIFPSIIMEYGVFTRTIYIESTRCCVLVRRTLINYILLRCSMPVLSIGDSWQKFA